MQANELREILKAGGLSRYSELYADLAAESKRILLLIDEFEKRFGEGRDIYVFSVPGRSEIVGNHTDHNNGKVLCGAIDRDIIAIAAKNDNGQINFHSEGYSPDSVRLADISSPDNFENFTSGALIAGLAKGFVDSGSEIGGFDAYSNTEVLKGSGISSSAAYEVMIGNIMNHLYNGGAVDNKRIAMLSQFAENVYFGKPSGLMDQMACAVGGFVFIDFSDPKAPKVEPIDFSLRNAGYSLCIVNTGGNHADLNEDYASVPKEMKAVAASLGRSVLCDATEEDILLHLGELRSTLGDRAILRSLHFVRENKRVLSAKEALLGGEVSDFLKIVSESGRSSFEYLQNVYTNKNVTEQGLSLALCISEGFLEKGASAIRVHGGGFAGTIQVFIKTEELPAYVKYINKCFGEGAAMALNIRPLGAVRLF